MKKSDVLACSFSEWYPGLQNVTFPSKIIPLPQEFVDYLLADNLVLRSDQSLIKYRKDTGHSFDDSENEEEDWAKAEKETPSLEAPRFEEIDQQIASEINYLGGKVFVKLNWSSPKDASWIALNNSLQCCMPMDIHLLLKSSDFILHDLTQPFKDCIDENIDLTFKVKYELILRKWEDINPGNEFRCFIRNKKIRGICQRDESQFYSYIQYNKEEIVRDIENFHLKNILHKFPLESYVIDVLRFQNHKVILVDINPYGPTTDSLLFDWNEDVLHEEELTETRNHPDFRFVSEEMGVRTNPLRRYCVPQDIAQLTAGEDPYKLIDLLNLKSGKLDSSDSDS